MKHNKSFTFYVGVGNIEHNFCDILFVCQGVTLWAMPFAIRTEAFVMLGTTFFVA